MEGSYVRSSKVHVGRCCCRSQARRDKGLAFLRCGAGATISVLASYVGGGGHRGSGTFWCGRIFFGSCPTVVRLIVLLQSRTILSCFPYSFTPCSTQSRNGL
jgi:hypothetical protein